ncbi:uncharacterized protein LOC126660534 [Mercurialis annua]|uniref:uncharacterized protein LOC126660534 n=1 Tax=Mercurialis annua TaxID=3986 RepID=UPI0021608531|nr:uncharacterized protein LOC126660534 [Mercurialis annua]
MIGKKRAMQDEPNANARKIGDDNAEINWKLRSIPPAHYLFKIENFSLLSDAKAECFRFADFEVGGYKWKLSVYPRGNKERKGDGYISLYLVLSESNNLTLNQEVNVNFKLFVYDYMRDKYLIIQDYNEEVRRFRGIKREWGFDKLISVANFKDDSNGYLYFDDCCMFGAEIFVIENGYIGECLSMVKKPADNTYTWAIENISELDLYSTESEVFSIGGTKWSILVYLKGDSFEKGKKLSIFLKLVDDANFDHGRKLYAEFMFRVRNQLVGKHYELQGLNHHFEPSKKTWGFLKFMSLLDLDDNLKGFTQNNSLIVEVEIQAMAMIKGLS